MADVPAIALGGLDEDLDRLSRLGCQFHARLRYPVQPRKLLVTIRRVIIEVRIASGLPEKEPAAGVPLELPGNRALAYTDFFGDLGLIQTSLIQPVNLIAYLAGEMLILIHLCSFYLVV